MALLTLVLSARMVSFGVCWIDYCAEGEVVLSGLQTWRERSWLGKKEEKDMKELFLISVISRRRRYGRNEISMAMMH